MIRWVSFVSLVIMSYSCRGGKSLRVGLGKSENRKISAYLKDYKADSDFSETATSLHNLLMGKVSDQTMLKLFLLWHMWTHKNSERTMKKSSKENSFCGKLPFVGVFSFISEFIVKILSREKRNMFWKKKRIE
jgi:hypothetical protein